MEMTINLDRYKNARYNFFKWRYETNLLNKLTLALGFAFLTALLAQVKFYLPGNIFVPITGQTFAVLLAGIILGRWGVVSLGLYVGIGAAGLPWFANITGSTMGYLIGFVIAAFFIGFITDKYVRSRNFISILSILLFATFVLIYIPGLIFLHYYLSTIGNPVNIYELIAIGMLPFIIGDIIKAVSAAVIAKVITPKKSYS